MFRLLCRNRGAGNMKTWIGLQKSCSPPSGSLGVTMHFSRGDFSQGEERNSSTGRREMERRGKGRLAADLQIFFFICSRAGVISDLCEDRLESGLEYAPLPPSPPPSFPPRSPPCLVKRGVFSSQREAGSNVVMVATSRTSCC